MFLLRGVGPVSPNFMGPPISAQYGLAYSDQIGDFMPESDRGLGSFRHIVYVANVDIMVVIEFWGLVFQLQDKSQKVLTTHTVSFIHVVS